MGFHGVFHGCLHVIFVGIFFWGELQSYQDSCLEDEVYKKSPLGWLCVPGIPVGCLCRPKHPTHLSELNSQVMAQPYGSQAWLGFPQVAAGLDPWGSQQLGRGNLLIHQNGVVSLRIPPRSLVEQCYVQVRSK